MNLRINYDETRSIGNQIISKAEEFKTLLNKINNINGQIASSWQGSDSAKYAEAVGIQANQMAQLASVISQTGEYLIKVSNAYANASETNKNSIRF